MLDALRNDPYIVVYLFFEKQITRGIAFAGLKGLILYKVNFKSEPFSLIWRKGLTFHCKNRCFRYKYLYCVSLFSFPSFCKVI